MFVRKTGRTPYKGPAMATDTRSERDVLETTAVIYQAYSAAFREPEPGTASVEELRQAYADLPMKGSSAAWRALRRNRAGSGICPTPAV